MISVYSIGKSVENRHLWVTRISQEVVFSRKGRQKRKQLKPMVKIVSNMHGNEVITGLLNYSIYVMGLPLYLRQLNVSRNILLFEYLLDYNFVII